MGTRRHSRASRKRWASVPKEERRARMSEISKSGWDGLSKRARRKRALNSVKSRKAHLEQSVNQ